MKQHHILPWTIFCLLLLSSCSGSKESANNQGMGAERFMPLAIGNQWVYSFASGPGSAEHTITVVGTTELNDKRWYLVEYTIASLNSQDTLLLRNDGDRHIAYLESQGEELVLIDFGRTTLDSTSMETAYVQEQDKTTTVRGQIYTGCVVVNSGFVDAEVATYAPGIGLVESWWFRGRKELIKARINGEKKVG